MKDLLHLLRHVELLKALVTRDLKARYKNSVLGYAWTWLDPLLSMSVLILVFGVLLNMGTENFAIYILTGLVPWNFFNNAVTLSVTSIIINAELIKRVFVPREIFPIATVLSNAINMLLGLFVILPVIVCFGVPLTAKLLLIPIPAVFLFLFTVGVSLTFTCLNVFFKDISYIVPFIVRLWFFVTPIFYVVDGRVPEHFVDIYMFANPLAVLVTLFRMCLMDGPAPATKYILVCFVSCIFVFYTGFIFFKRNDDRMIKRV
jgi:ABC-type polysaccharide/polyol phosphate export permease